MMDKSSGTLSKLDGIYDIYPPAIPEMGTIEIVLMTLCAALLISSLFYIVRVRFYSIKGKNIRRIRSLQKRYESQLINSHDAAYQLCDYLKDGLAIKKIDIKTPVATALTEKQPLWERFTSDITNLRYKNNQPLNKYTHKDFNALFSDALYWLKVWPK